MKEFFKKYTREIIFVGAIILLLLVSTCSYRQQLKAEGQKVELVKQLAELKDSIVTAENNRAIEKDSLDKDTAKKQAIIDSLNQNDINNKKKIADLKRDLENKRKEVASYNSQQVAIFINERYNTNTTVATDTTVTTTTSTGVKVVTELVEKDACIEEVKVKDSQLVDKNKVIEQTNGQLQNKTTELSSAEESIKLLKEAQKKSEDLHKIDNKIIKKLKVGNTVKWILIPAAFVTGFLIAK
jgi:hypothetical protein